MCVVLPKGYTLIARSGDIVVAYNPNAPAKYVTWEVDKIGNGVHWGHYFADLVHAAKDFEERRGKDEMDC